MTSLVHTLVSSLRSCISYDEDAYNYDDIVNDLTCPHTCLITTVLTFFMMKTHNDEGNVNDNNDNNEDVSMTMVLPSIMMKMQTMMVM